MCLSPKNKERNTKMVEDLLKFITFDALLLAFLLHIFLPYLKDCVRYDVFLGTIIAILCSLCTSVLLFHSLLYTICIPIYGGFDNACKVLCPENSQLNTINQTRKEQKHDTSSCYKD